MPIEYDNLYRRLAYCFALYVLFMHIIISIKQFELILNSLKSVH